jgi:hypothetical protein
MMTESAIRQLRQDIVASGRLLGENPTELAQIIQSQIYGEVS